MSYEENPEEEGKEENPLSRMVDDLIIRAIKEKASDIHFEPLDDKVSVYLRVDGIMRLIDSMSLSNLETAISRLKVMAQLDITERRKPQDGHILFYTKGLLPLNSINLRLSVFPTIFGSAAVIRILYRQDLLFENFEKLGLDKETTEKLGKTLKKRSGMILVTGPGGSGKTTTLYTILNSLKSKKEKLNILTLEDPVELSLPGIRQSQIYPEIEFTFATGLRSILRQDADAIMVGEIRDRETADISIRSTLTGSLFFSTMHTMNSVGAIARFLEFNLPRSLISFSLIAVIAQRLVRNICPNCKTKAKSSRDLIDLAKISKEDESKLLFGKGCDSCGNTGYLGRTGIFEVMFIDKEIQRLILEEASFAEIEMHAINNGMQTLREAALKKVLQGITTLDEVFRVISL